MDMNVEELHIAAKAYYSNSSLKLQQLAKDFFRLMDKNGDGLVSLNEFAQYFKQCGYRWSDPNLFRCLDRNRDGCLDFNEALTLYYVVKTRGVWCNQCRTCLMGLYFTCVECFDTANDTYDLCATCYSARSFRHHHATFSDSYVLLRSKRRRPPGVANPNRASVPQPYAATAPRQASVPQPYAATAPRQEMSASEALDMGNTVCNSLDFSEASDQASKVLKALEIMIDVGDIVGCSIM